MKRILTYLLPVIALAFFLHCGESDPEINPEVRQIPIEMEVHRFEQAFDRVTPEQLADLKGEYPYLFPASVPDSVWLAKQSDSLQQLLRDEVRAEFADFQPYAQEIELLFKHALYYFPGLPVPEVVTLTNDVDVANRVVLTDSLLLIGLDNYLGPGHEFYANIDRYVASGLDPDLLVSDIASALAQKIVPYSRERSFVAQMVYHGKTLYLKDRLMPLAPDSVKIGYSKDQMEWARANEGQIWRYFIERELLYDTSRELGPRFLDPAPFSKFRLLLDNESPGRVGRYVGWQIVRSFMEENDRTLGEMLRTPAETLFKTSKYKPPK